MGLTTFAQDIAFGLGDRVSALSEALFDPTLRLGVTGLARAGKTVFITSLVSNLIDRARMPQLHAQAQGRIARVYLQPSPDVTVPRFDYERNRAALLGPAPVWPVATRAISQLRLTIEMAPAGFLGRSRALHLDIVDYPGEWLLDLSLLPLGFGEWSAQVLERLRDRPEAAGFLDRLQGLEETRWDEGQALALAESYAAMLAALRAAGLSDVTPGRFLMPGDLAGSPALTFAPMPRPESPARSGLWRAFERRFEAYKTHVVRPFFRDHFARIDRQVVLVDALEAIHQGPAALEDMRRAMAGVLAGFKPGRGGLLSDLWAGRRVERILFAATRADHLHHAQHPRLAAILAAMLREAKDRADFAGAQTAAMAIAALRATTEAEVTRDGQVIQAVQGVLQGTGRAARMFPGDLPSDPARLLDPARAGAGTWLGADYAVMRFAPAPIELAPGEGLPHIRLDRAVEFLIGDRL